MQAEDEPFSMFCPSCRSFIARPYIGVITKVDSPHANVPMVRQWLKDAGCERIFEVNNTTREGITELLDYLEGDLPKLTIEEAIKKQRMGINEWEPFPEEM